MVGERVENTSLVSLAKMVDDIRQAVSSLMPMLAQMNQISKEVGGNFRNLGGPNAPGPQSSPTSSYNDFKNSFTKKAWEGSIKYNDPKNKSAVDEFLGTESPSKSQKAAFIQSMQREHFLEQQKSQNVTSQLDISKQDPRTDPYASLRGSSSYTAAQRRLASEAVAMGGEQERHLLYDFSDFYKASKDSESQAGSLKPRLERLKSESSLADQAVKKSIYKSEDQEERRKKEIEAKKYQEMIAVMERLITAQENLSKVTVDDVDGQKRATKAYLEAQQEQKELKQKYGGGGGKGDKGDGGGWAGGVKKFAPRIAFVAEVADLGYNLAKDTQISLQIERTGKEMQLMSNVWKEQGIVSKRTADQFNLNDPRNMLRYRGDILFGAKDLGTAGLESAQQRATKTVTDELKTEQFKYEKTRKDAIKEATLGAAMVVGGVVGMLTSTGAAAATTLASFGIAGVPATVAASAANIASAGLIVTGGSRISDAYKGLTDKMTTNRYYQAQGGQAALPFIGNKEEAERNIMVAATRMTLEKQQMVDNQLTQAADSRRLELMALTERQRFTQVRQMGARAVGRYATTENDIIGSYNQFVSPYREPQPLVIDREPQPLVIDRGTLTRGGKPERQFANEISELGMTPSEFAQKRDLFSSVTKTGAASMRDTTRMIRLSQGGFGSEEVLAGNIADLNRITGGRENNQRQLETVLANAVASGFDKARTSQAFLQSSQSIAETLRLSRVDTAANMLNTAQRYLAVDPTRWKNDESALRAAQAGIQSYGQISSTQEGVIGAYKTSKIWDVTGGSMLATGFLKGTSAIEAGEMLKQLNDKNPTNATLVSMKQAGMSTEQIKQALTVVRRGAIDLIDPFVRGIGQKIDPKKNLQGYISEYAGLAMNLGMVKDRSTGMVMGLESAVLQGAITEEDASKKKRELDEAVAGGAAKYKNPQQIAAAKFVGDLWSASKQSDKSVTSEQYRSYVERMGMPERSRSGKVFDEDFVKQYESFKTTKGVAAPGGTQQSEFKEYESMLQNMSKMDMATRLQSQMESGGGQKVYIENTAKLAQEIALYSKQNQKDLEDALRRTVTLESKTRGD